MKKRAIIRRPAEQTGLPGSYGDFLKDIKTRVRAAQIKAALSANSELIDLYWHIGGSIVERQRREGWGKSVVERLAADLRREFPGVGGFSSQNIWFMRSFFLAWTREAPNLLQAVREFPGREPDGRILPQAVREIPWGHNIQLITKLKDPMARLWYAQKAIKHGWSRDILVHQMESGLHKRQGKALTNFKRTLPPPHSDLARQTIKDPYIFDFLTLAGDAQERELEQGLLNHVQKFLVEMGVGFAFVGRQFHLEVGGRDYYIDLLLYHLRLRCYVAVELKAGEFRPEYAGKMNFYLSAVDDGLRHPDDKPAIGLILCKSRDRLTVEYALRDIRKPIGIANWRTKLVEALSRELKGHLPTIEDLEKELGPGA